MHLRQLQKASMAEKNGFDITKLIFQNMCVWQCGAVVKEFLASADEPGSTPSDASFSVSLYSFIIMSQYETLECCPHYE